MDSKKTLTLEGAEKVIAAAKAEAKKNHEGGVIAVVDDDGNLMALERTDGTFAAGATISMRKALIAVLFQKPGNLRKELPYSGVFSLHQGELKLVSKDLSGPNGLAFSPDEKYLYVDNWDLKNEVIMRYQVHPDGTLSDGRVFFDATGEPGEDAWDGMRQSCEGPVSLRAARNLGRFARRQTPGTIIAPMHPHNMALGR